MQRKRAGHRARSCRGKKLGGFARGVLRQGRGWRCTGRRMRDHRERSVGGRSPEGTDRCWLLMLKTARSCAQPLSGSGRRPASSSVTWSPPLVLDGRSEGALPCSYEHRHQPRSCSDTVRRMGTPSNRRGGIQHSFALRPRACLKLSTASELEAMLCLRPRWSSAASPRRQPSHRPSTTTMLSATYCV